MENLSQTPLRIRVEREIGRGAHSRVKLGRDLDTLEPLAVKLIDLDDSGREVYKTEVENLRRLPDHRCIPRLHGFYATSARGCIVIEYLPFPTLKTLLEDGAMTETQSLQILRQLIDVLHYMTARGVAHRDIKTENLIVNPDNWSIKLIDYGLSTEVSSEDTTDSSYRGTPIYMAPEVLREMPCYSVVKAELWSIGVIFWECLTGAHPFSTAKSRRDLLLKQTQVVDMTESLPEYSQEIVRSLLNLSPRKRPTIATVLELVETEWSKRSGEVRPIKRNGSGERRYSLSRIKSDDSEVQIAKVTQSRETLFRLAPNRSIRSKEERQLKRSRVKVE